MSAATKTKHASKKNTKPEVKGPVKKEPKTMANAVSETQTPAPATNPQSIVATAPYKPDAYTVVKLHLRLIDVPYDWNDRTYGDVIRAVDDKEETENKGITGTMSSIESIGQTDPVVVRLHPKGDKAKKAYSLVKGFRRLTAIERLGQEGKAIRAAGWEDWSAADPYILAIVKDLTESQAIVENSSENLSRENLKVPDQARAVARMLSANGANMTQMQIQEQIGKTQGHISKLSQVSKIDPKVFEKWRKASVQLSIENMRDVAKLDRDAQDAKYEAILKEKTPSVNNRKNANSWLEAAKTKAKTVGAMLGALEVATAIVVDPNAGDEGADVEHFDLHLNDFVRGVKKADPAKDEPGATQVERREIAIILHNAYVAARKEGSAASDAAAAVEANGATEATATADTSAKKGKKKKGAAARAN